MCEPTALISDHKLVIFELSHRKSYHKTSRREVRKVKGISDAQWCESFNSSNINLTENLDVVCQQLNAELSRVYDTLAPPKSISVSDRYKVEWFDDEIIQQRKITRRREEIWKRYHEEHQFCAFKRERNRLNRMLLYKRSSTITRKILKANRDSKALHKIVNRELGKMKRSYYQRIIQIQMVT